MAIAIEALSQTEQFKNYLDSLQDPGSFEQRLVLEATRFKIDRLEEHLPRGLTPDQLAATILLNLQQDYDFVVTDLPAEFQAKESLHSIHPECTNQIGIYYWGEIQKGKKVENFRVACLSLHFLDMGDKQVMYINNVQGELNEERRGHFSHREVRRVFGKLNSHFREDWRVGLVRQVIEYARDRSMEVKGRVPGVFWFLGDSLPEYPLYSLYYVQTFLQSGIPLENIEFAQLPKNVQLRWRDTVDFLQTKTLDERLHLLALATDEYAKSYRRFKYQWFREKAIDLSTFEANTAREGLRVFAEYLS